MRSTRLCGGSSLTKRMASLREMKWAVAGRVARKWSSSRPSCSPWSLNFWPSDLFCAGLVAVGIEFESAAALGAVDGPAGEDARHLGDVGLGVAAVDAEGVQFHQFAGVVFVESLAALLLVPGRRAAAISARSAASESGPMLSALSR